MAPAEYVGIFVPGSSSDESSFAAWETGDAWLGHVGHSESEFARSVRGIAMHSLHGVFSFGHNWPSSVHLTPPSHSLTCFCGVARSSRVFFRSLIL